jgi:hypothetical protein
MPTGGLSLAESTFADRLAPRGRILEDPDHYVWGCSPVYGPDSRVHVFYSRWPREHGWRGYLLDCEVAHAVADTPEGPYEPADEPVALAGAPGDGEWDSRSIHNPEVRRIGDRYAMVYYGSSVYNRNELWGKIGLAFADALDGPWTRHPDNPVIDRGGRGEWDSVEVNNPTLLPHPNGRVLLYYRSWTGRDHDVRNDKVGLATAEDVEGPYRKHDDNPVIDPTTVELSSVTPAAARQVGIEDPYAFVTDGGVGVLARDFGLSGGRRGSEPGKGLLFRSEDGIEFPHEPEIAYHEASHYYDLGDGDERLRRYGRFERPKLLLGEGDGKPTHLFNAIVGGEHGLSTGHVFELRGA